MSALPHREDFKTRKDNLSDSGLSILVLLNKPEPKEGLTSYEVEGNDLHVSCTL